MSFFVNLDVLQKSGIYSTLVMLPVGGTDLLLLRKKKYKILNLDCTTRAFKLKNGIILEGYPGECFFLKCGRKRSLV